MSNLKIINNEKLSDWAKDIFENNSYNMVDVSEKLSLHPNVWNATFLY